MRKSQLILLAAYGLGLGTGCAGTHHNDHGAQNHEDNAGNAVENWGYFKPTPELICSKHEWVQREDGSWGLYVWIGPIKLRLEESVSSWEEVVRLHEQEHP